MEAKNPDSYLKRTSHVTGACRNHVHVPEDSEDDHIQVEKSHHPIEIADIAHITFGGTSSRFWMYRKYFSLMSLEELENSPFKSWECLTILLSKGIEINLVIKDEKAM